MIKKNNHYKTEGLTPNSILRTINYLKASCKDCETGVEHVGCPISGFIKEWSQIYDEQIKKQYKRY